MSDRFDLIVVGAGALGTFHAYHAANAGLKVLLIEKDKYPVNATVRNFGQVVPSGLSSSWFEFGRRANSIYSTIQNEYDISVRNNGSVYLASDQHEQNLIHELKTIMDAKNYGCDILTIEQCLKKWPSLKRDYIKEALFFPQEVSVEPDQMIYKLIEFCVQKFRNLTYRSYETIVACEPERRGSSVTTNSLTKYHADKIVICNGGEFKLLFANIFRESGIVISKLQMMRTQPMDGVELEGNILTGLTIRRYESFTECPSFNSGKTPDHLQELVNWGIHILFKKAKDNSVIIGDSHEYATAEKIDDLGFSGKQHVNELMLAEAQKIVSFNVRNIATTWNGYYPQHPDKDIVEHDIENCIHIRTAIGGKGMSSAAGYSEKSIQSLFNLS